MNISESLRGLLRRWYITFPGLILAVAVGLGAWLFLPVTYERSATQLLLPGAGNVPTKANPLLYLGGLSFAADVLVRAVGSESTLNDIKKQYPDASVTVTRDDTSGGPFIVVKVDAPTDAEAGRVVSLFLNTTANQLESLQQSQGIMGISRIGVVAVAVDQKSTEQNRTRLVATFGGGATVLALALLLASLVDGLGRRRRLLPDVGSSLPATRDSTRGPIRRRARYVLRRKIPDPGRPGNGVDSATSR